MSTINETYYGIRMGDPRRHRCYLRLQDDRGPVSIPELFETREKAEAKRATIGDTACTRVVRVKITCG